MIVIIILSTVGPKRAAASSSPCSYVAGNQLTSETLIGIAACLVYTPKWAAITFKAGTFTRVVCTIQHHHQQLRTLEGTCDCSTDVPVSR